MSRPHPFVPVLLAVTGVALIGALAAGCSEPPAGPAPSAQPAPPAALGGVALDQPLHLTGTEPFWGVDIAGGRLTYSGVDRPERVVDTPGAVVQGTTATWTGASQGQLFVVTLIATECSDGMSDRTYPLTARVEVSGETLNGCANTAAALAAAPPP